MSIDQATGLQRRGTTNRNARGSAEDRRRRRAYLLETYAADWPMTRVVYFDGRVEYAANVVKAERLLELYGPTGPAPLIQHAEDIPTCRCYRCGALLHDETVTVDRIVPGCKGGTYRRSNIRPACARCNTETGAPLRANS